MPNGTYGGVRGRRNSALLDLPVGVSAIVPVLETVFETVLETVLEIILEIVLKSLLYRAELTRYLFCLFTPRR